MAGDVENLWKIVCTVRKEEDIVYPSFDGTKIDDKEKTEDLVKNIDQKYNSRYPMLCWNMK